jgi:hypothetical protein
MMKNEIAVTWLLAAAVIAMIGVGSVFSTGIEPVAPAGQVNVRAPSTGLAPAVREDIVDDANFLRAERPEPY